MRTWIEEAGRSPLYLKVDLLDLTARLTQFPVRSDIPVPVDEQLVVEYYNRRT